MKYSHRYFYVKIYGTSKRTLLFMRIILIFHSFAFMLDVIINFFAILLLIFFKLSDMLPINNKINN